MEQFTILPLFLIPAVFILFSLSLPLISSIIPCNFQLLSESLYRTILSLLNSNVRSSIFFPLLFAIFHLVFISNFIGLIPYSITASTEFIITLSLAVTLLLGIFIYGTFSHGNASLIVHLFLPAGTPVALLLLMVPLEILAYFTRTLSLGLRLAANLITGHILVKVVLSFFPSSSALASGSGFATAFFVVLFLVVFLALEILIAYLQAYIFVFITIITIKDITA
jgi:ATP synthase subunit 6